MLVKATEKCFRDQHSMDSCQACNGTDMSQWHGCYGEKIQEFNGPDIPPDSAKLQRQSTKVRCTYCKAEGHNSRTCDAKKSDMRKQAASDGVTPNVGRSTVKCRNCKQGQDSRSCTVKKQATINTPK